MQDLLTHKKYPKTTMKDVVLTLHVILASCKALAGNQYVSRHNNALMVLAAEWGKEAGLLEENTV